MYLLGNSYVSSGSNVFWFIIGFLFYLGAFAFIFGPFLVVYVATSREINKNIYLAKRKLTFSSLIPFIRWNLLLKRANQYVLIKYVIAFVSCFSFIVWFYYIFFYIKSIFNQYYFIAYILYLIVNIIVLVIIGCINNKEVKANEVLTIDTLK